MCDYEITLYSVDAGNGFTNRISENSRPEPPFVVVCNVKKKKKHTTSPAIGGLRVRVQKVYPKCPITFRFGPFGLLGYGPREVRVPPGSLTAAAGGAVYEEIKEKQMFDAS